SGFHSGACGIDVWGHDDVNLELHQIGGVIVKLAWVPKASLKNDVLSFYVTKFTQAMLKRLKQTSGPIRGDRIALTDTEIEISYPWDFGRLLRSGGRFSKRHHGNDHKK